MKGRYNCTACTRWRPVYDFRPRWWLKGGQIGDVNRECNSCHRTRQKEYYRSLPKAKKRIRAEQSREAQAVKRRKEGIPYKPQKNRGAGRVKPISRDEQKKRRDRHIEKMKKEGVYEEFLEKERARKKRVRDRER